VREVCRLLEIKLRFVLIVVKKSVFEGDVVVAGGVAGQRGEAKALDGKNFGKNFGLKAEARWQQGAGNEGTEDGKTKIQSKGMKGIRLQLILGGHRARKSFPLLLPMGVISRR
jgi:hypothetical protein